MSILLKKMISVAVLLFVPALTLGYEEVEDLVDVFVTDGEFIAVVDSRRNFRDDLGSKEVVLWQGAKGEVGAFLTNERLLAVSIMSGQWNTKPLKIREKKTEPRMQLSAHLVVMLTDERIVGFGTRTGGFVETRLPIGESIIASDAHGRVATAITPDRAFAFSSNWRGVAEVRFRVSEQFESVKTSYNKITLQTSQRLITFAANDAVWREIELN